MATTTPDINKAATDIMAAELKAAQDLQAAAKVFDEAMASVLTTLNYPPNFRSQIVDLVQSIRSQLQYPITSQLPSIIQGYSPTDTLTTTTVPTVAQ